MSTPQHTPGPWHVTQHNHADGDLWLSIGYTDGDGHRRGPVADVTEVPVAELKYLSAPETVQWANARLMAASPLMLEALQLLMQATESGSFHELGGAVRKARAAIGAATGERQ